MKAKLGFSLFFLFLISVASRNIISTNCVMEPPPSPAPGPVPIEEPEPSPEDLVVNPGGIPSKEEPDKPSGIPGFSHESILIGLVTSMLVMWLMSKRMTSHANATHTNA
jgi:hypothetical protein